MNLIGGIVLVAVAVVALFLFVPVGMVNRDLALCVVGLLVSWLRWLLWLPGLLASGQFSLIGLSNLKRRTGFTALRLVNAVIPVLVPGRVRLRPQ